ncbi:MAG: trigger factor [Bacteroidales bacterium]
MNITQESNGELQATINVKLTAEDYKSKVDEALKEAQKKASMKGFRPGKVPYGLIKKMYGKSVMAEEVNKLLSDSLSNYIVENKLDILGYPLSSKEKETKVDFDNDEEFEFFFDIGLTPKFDLEINDKIEVDYYEIEVDDDKVDGYLKEVTTRYGNPVNPEISEKGDLLRGEISELTAEGEIKEDGIKNNTSLSIEFIKDENVQKEFIGRKKGDKIRFNPLKATNNKAETSSMLGIKKEETEKMEADYEFEISEISRMEPAEINQELFDKVYPNGNITSEEAFREKLRSEAKDYFQNEGDNFFVHEVIEKLVNETHVDLPVEFVKRWLVESDENITPENVEKDFENYGRSLKQQLIVNKIAADNDIKVEQQDIKNFVREMYARQFGMDIENEEMSKQLDQFADMVLKNQDEVRKIYDQLFDKQVRELFKTKLNLNKKKISYDDFIKIVNEHHHHNHDHHEHE